MKSLLLFVTCLMVTAAVVAQNAVTFSPEKPKPGEVITVTISPPQNSKSTIVEAVVFTRGDKQQDLNSLKLAKKGDGYTGTIQTQPKDNFVAVGVKFNDKFDTNGGEGYILPLYDGEGLADGANLSAALFYSGNASLVGLEDPSSEKALEYLEAEFESNPSAKKEQIITYARLQAQQDKEKANEVYQKAIEWLLKEGLKDEEDYVRLEMLYRLAKLPAQMNFVSNVKKEKFPDGNWKLNGEVAAFMAEKDPQKKEQLLADFLEAVKKLESPGQMEGAGDYMLNQLFTGYASDKKYAEFERAFEKFELKGPQAAQLYNSAAWSMQERGEDLERALQYAQKAVDISKREIDNPTGEKPYYLTEDAWKASRKKSYSVFADTYAMVQYRLGNYKAGYPYAREAALDIQEGKNADFNKTYVLLAKEVVSPKKLQPQLEKFVLEGKADSTATAALKEVYAQNSKKGNWKDYYSALQAKAAEKAMAELEKSMIHEPAPMFALMDARGQKVDLKDLKNKVVIVDFWATWCGPCKASFPGMQKMVDKYQEDEEVAFLFVNSWESIEDQKEKEKAVNEFISKNNYDFRVLFDNDNKVIESFGVSGIPTKFVIDKKGNIRFKSVGYGGSDAQLMNELTGMIELAKKG